MKRLLLFILCMQFACSPVSEGWKVVWEENFDRDDVIDETIWSKIPRGSSDWQPEPDAPISVSSTKTKNIPLN
jgi:hypothetical protein